MEDLRNYPMKENLAKKLNTGVIPRVDPLTNWVVQEDANTNSFFAIGRYETEGHILVYQLHFMLLLKVGVINYNISITDETTGEYYFDDKVMPVDQATVETIGEGADAKQIIRMPNGCLEATSTQMHWEGILENGKITMDMEAYGYPVYNAGGGIFASCMKDEVFRQYSLPTMKTKGTIAFNGKTYTVEGNSWVDRQWQQQAENSDLINAVWNWIWMDINLENGDVISLWDMNSITRNFDYAWATLMHPDGTQSVLRMELLADSATEYWESPASGNKYPIAFDLKLPDINTELQIKSVVKESEIVSQVPYLCKYEGSCLVEGIHQGKNVKGYCLLEELGMFK